MLKKSAYLFFLFLLCNCVIAIDFEITLNSQIEFNGNTATGQFIAGTKDDSIDSVDSNDGRMMEAPSYSIPLYSVMGGEYFMVDYRSTLTANQPKVWNINQKGSKEFRASGTLKEIIRWEISQSYQDINFVLKDYGSDSSRTSLVKEIDLKQQESYNFSVTRPFNEYRYFSIEVLYFVSESQTVSNLTLTNNTIQTSSNQNTINPISLINEQPISSDNYAVEDFNNSIDDETNQIVDAQPNSVIQQINSSSDVAQVNIKKKDNNKEECTNEWLCNPWSRCSENLQSRDCIDTNECGDGNERLYQSRRCSSEANSEEPIISSKIINEKTNTVQDLGNFVPGIIIDMKKPNPVVGIIVSLTIIIIGLVFAIFYVKVKYS